MGKKSRKKFSCTKTAHKSAHFSILRLNESLEHTQSNEHSQNVLTSECQPKNGHFYKEVKMEEEKEVKKPPRYGILGRVESRKIKHLGSHYITSPTLGNTPPANIHPLEKICFFQDPPEKDTKIKIKTPLKYQSQTLKKFKNSKSIKNCQIIEVESEKKQNEVKPDLLIKNLKIKFKTIDEDEYVNEDMSTLDEISITEDQPKQKEKVQISQIVKHEGKNKRLIHIPDNVNGTDLLGALVQSFHRRDDLMIVCSTRLLPASLLLMKAISHSMDDIYTDDSVKSLFWPIARRTAHLVGESEGMGIGQGGHRSFIIRWVKINREVALMDGKIDHRKDMAHLRTRIATGILDSADKDEIFEGLDHEISAENREKYLTRWLKQTKIQLHMLFITIIKRYPKTRANFNLYDIDPVEKTTETLIEQKKEKEPLYQELEMVRETVIELVNNFHELIETMHTPEYEQEKKRLGITGRQKKETIRNLKKDFTNEIMENLERLRYDGQTRGNINMERYAKAKEKKDGEEWSSQEELDDEYNSDSEQEECLNDLAEAEMEMLETLEEEDSKKLVREYQDI